MVDAGVLKVDDGGFCDGLHGADGFEEVELRKGRIGEGVFGQDRDVAIGDSLAVQGEDGLAQQDFEVLGVPVADDLDFDAFGFEDFGCIDMCHGLVVVGDLAGVAAVCDESVAIGMHAVYVFEAFLKTHLIVEVLVRVEEDAPVSFFQTAFEDKLEAFAVVEADEVLPLIILFDNVNSNIDCNVFFGYIHNFTIDVTRKCKILIYIRIVHLLLFNFHPS